MDVWAVKWAVEVMDDMLMENEDAGMKQRVGEYWDEAGADGVMGDGGVMSR